MKKNLLCFIFLGCVSLQAAKIPLGSPQEETERTSQAIVRNKQYYKAGRIEITGIGGTMPYDSLVTSYMVGGRATWHITDHIGWEIVDGQFVMPTVTSYTLGLVTRQGISNLQTLRLRAIITSNFLFSPLYGKVRLWGNTVLYFDTYLVAGFGFVNDETIREATTAKNNPVTETILRSGWDPVADVGLGFKIFLGSTVGLLIDLRDYITYAPTYGGANLKNNFSVYLGITMFLPGLGGET